MFGFYAYTQEVQSFFVKIVNEQNIPNVTHSRNGIRKAYSKTQNSKLDNLLNRYKIYSCKKVFKNSKKASLQNIYLIECNDLQLMDDLYDKFKSIYPIVENGQGIPLTTPNDYGSTGGYTGPGSSQEDLDFIRAIEAWGVTTGSENIKIGVADTKFSVNHEDLENTISVINPSQNTNPKGSGNAFHGSVVSGFAAANTDNGKGGAAIGYNSFISARAQGMNVNALSELSLVDGVKVLNASWYIASSLDGTLNQTASLYQPVIDEIINDRKKVLIAAAGNGEDTPGNPNLFLFPASYKDVISVSSICHKSDNVLGIEYFLDSHQYKINGEMRSHQHNDSVDIVAPGYGLFRLNPFHDSYTYNDRGTSYAAPIVAGTVALMFDVNNCIDPKEVETVLKLTAVKIDNLPQNIQYYGKLGAGKLDAYEAVKMAKDMADTFGTVEVKNRILYRPWFYKLETAPYEIKMINNDVTGGSKLKFKARNNIEILSGYYYPDTGGYIDLSIDATLALNCLPPPASSSNSSKKIKNKIDNIKGGIPNRERGVLVYPNPTTGILNIISKESLNQITISDITGKVVYNISNINKNELQVDISKFNLGIYFMKMKMKMESGETTSTKVVKE